MPELIPLIAPLAGSAISTLLNKQSQGDRTSDINQILNRQFGDYALGRNTIFGTGNGTPGMFSNLGDPALTNQNRMLDYLYGGSNGGAFGNLNDLIGQIYNQPTLNNNYGFQNGADPYGQNTPGLQDNIGLLQSLLPQLQQQSGRASDVFSGNGQTPESQASFRQMEQLMNGQGLQQQGMTNMANNLFSANGNINPLFQSIMNASAQGIAGVNPTLDMAQSGVNSIFGNQGQTNDTNSGIRASQGMFANGGMTPSLQGLEGTGFNVLGQNGLTPTGMQGENAALQVLSNGGATPTTQGLQGRGMDLANRESLLPMNQVASMAANRAATTYQNNMEAAQRNAQSRGGGPGSTVANGLTNRAMADYADQGSQAQASAVQDALVQQQGLQLQQANMGANMANAGGTLENNRFGTAANTLTGLENVAANRFGLGGNFIQGANNAATNRASTGLSSLGQLTGLQSGREMGALGMLPGIAQTRLNEQNVFGNMGLGANSQSLQGIGLGGNMYNDVTQNMLGYNNAYNNLIGTGDQYGLGAGNLANQGQNSMGNIIQQMLGGNFEAANQGLNRTGQYYNTQNTGLNHLGSQQQFGATQGQQGTNNYMQLLSMLFPWMQGQGSAADDMAYRNANPGSSAWGPLASSAVTGILGPLFGGGFGGNKNLGGGSGNGNFGGF